MKMSLRFNTVSAMDSVCYHAVHAIASAECSRVFAVAGMAYPRHALQSVEIAAVTQIRASDDYVPNVLGSQTQWKIGASSILANALALAPFKDNFWLV